MLTPYQDDAISCITMTFRAATKATSLKAMDTIFQAKHPSATELALTYQ